jgi:hypothetical protein
MYIYIAKFKEQRKAFKIGKANNIASRLNKLSKTHGDVVYLRYIKCSDENIALNIEAIIHNTFNKRESLGYSYGIEDALVKGDGSSEFFIDTSVIERLSFIEDYVSDFGYEMKCAKIDNNKLIDINLEELYNLELEHFQWYIHNIHWGKNYNKSGKEYEIDKRITKELNENKEVNESCINEYLRIEKDMRNYYSQKLKFADKYSPTKIAKFNISNKSQFAENYFNHLYMLDKGYGSEQRFIDLFNVQDSVLKQIKSDNFQVPKEVSEENKILDNLYHKFKEII